MLAVTGKVPPTRLPGQLPVAMIGGSPCHHLFSQSPHLGTEPVCRPASTASPGRSPHRVTALGQRHSTAQAATKRANFIGQLPRSQDPKPFSRQRRRPAAEATNTKLLSACRRRLESDYRRPQGRRCLRYVAPRLPSAGVGKTPYHLASLLILKSVVEIEDEIWI